MMAEMTWELSRSRWVASQAPALYRRIPYTADPTYIHYCTQGQSGCGTHQFDAGPLLRLGVKRGEEGLLQCGGEGQQLRPTAHPRRHALLLVLL